MAASPVAIRCLKKHGIRIIVRKPLGHFFDKPGIAGTPFMRLIARRTLPQNPQHRQIGQFRCRFLPGRNWQTGHGTPDSDFPHRFP